MEMEAFCETDLSVNVQTGVYPYCIIWSPIPMITWVFPFIGHLGIATREGIIFDFAGSYHIGQNSFAFGAPTKYFQCLHDNDNVVNDTSWNESIEMGNAMYEKRMHNLFWDNCHSHVASCLNANKFQNKRWNMVNLAYLLFVHGTFTNAEGMLKTWLPFLTILILVFIVQYL